MAVKHTEHDWPDTIDHIPFSSIIPNLWESGNSFPRILLYFLASCTQQKKICQPIFLLLWIGFGPDVSSLLVGVRVVPALSSIPSLQWTLQRINGWQCRMTWRTTINSSPWIWKGVSATSQSGRYTLSYPRGQYTWDVPTMYSPLLMRGSHNLTQRPPYSEKNNRSYITMMFNALWLFETRFVCVEAGGEAKGFNSHKEDPNKHKWLKRHLKHYCYYY